MLVRTTHDNPFDWTVTYPPALTLPAALASEVGGSTTAFLIHLADWIDHHIHPVGRPIGDPLPPGDTLATRAGACRSLGLAARFVSGYSMHHPVEVSEHDLHAWAEVYLPGAGWRGYDPSFGLAVGDGHEVLTAAPDHQLAAAVSGSYRASGVGSSLRFGVQVHTAGSLEELRGLGHPIRAAAGDSLIPLNQA
jgi:transglutaminase-like putative cysteine protease